LSAYTYLLTCIVNAASWLTNGNGSCHMPHTRQGQRRKGRSLNSTTSDN